MDVLPTHFRTFRFFGLWYEDVEDKFMLKIIYRILVLTFMVQFTLLQFIGLFSVSASIEEVAENLFLMLTYVINFYKMIIFMQNKNKVKSLLDQFRLDMCKAKNITEQNILTHYQDKAKSTYKFRMILTVACGASFILMPIINTHKIDLPYKINFFDVTTKIRFAVAYVLQSVPAMMSIVTDVTLDSFYCACIILTCSQLDLCCFRILSDDETKKSVKNYAKHHALIIKIVHKIQSTFMSSILPIFASALVTLCTSVYQLSQVISYKYLFIKQDDLSLYNHKQNY